MCCSDEEIMLFVDQMHYPRTGKRGVPQQFPRRLYEMLEVESQCEAPAISATHDEPIVHWSVSGRAFRITDVSLFSTKILPTYFKTSKFSSFQRNLNLYGFGKIRKGPEVNMYFHPSFVRGDKDGLFQLRKRNNSPTKKKSKTSQPSICPVSPSPSYCPRPSFASISYDEESIDPKGQTFVNSQIVQSITIRNLDPRNVQQVPVAISNLLATPTYEYGETFTQSRMVTPTVESQDMHTTSENLPVSQESPKSNCSGGKLFLLAEAMRQVIEQGH